MFDAICSMWTPPLSLKSCEAQKTPDMKAYGFDPVLHIEGGIGFSLISCSSPTDVR